MECLKPCRGQDRHRPIGLGSLAAHVGSWSFRAMIDKGVFAAASAIAMVIVACGGEAESTGPVAASSTSSTHASTGDQVPHTGTGGAPEPGRGGSGGATGIGSSGGAGGS